MHVDAKERDRWLRAGWLHEALRDAPLGDPLGHGIVAAARAAYAHDFITMFPRGYDTPVGEHGAQLAGGERQRIAVARALLKDAPIILLDEATAFVDNETEAAIHRSIERVAVGLLGVGPPR